MPPAIAPPASLVRRMIAILGDQTRCTAMDEAEWDLLVRTARSARLLGTLSHALRGGSIRSAAPEAVKRHLDAAEVEARYLRQMALREMASVGRALQGVKTPLLLLKGGAYIAQELPVAAGRLPRDLDLMVARDRLDETETVLRDRGWQFEKKLTAYDQHYYRAWSHELPPLRLPGHAFEVDLHHNILPPIGRLKPDAERLIADSVPVPGSPFRVLRPADQVLHAAVHLFQDSDCVGKLRDLVDIDGLVRHFSAQAGDGFWQQLAGSTAVHGLGRPLWYALAFCRAWLDTPVPNPAWEALQANRPPALARALMTALAARVLPPVHPDAEASVVDRLAASALEFRSLWLRMPPWTLAYHAANKLLRSTRSSSARTAVG